MHSKVIIICPVHGEFKQTPSNHLKSGCKKCTFDNKRNKFDNVLLEFKKIHEDNYDYSNSEYEGMHKKIKIICKKHGEFKQTPVNHLQGKGCPKCASNYKKDYDLILNKLCKLHNNSYIYENNFPITANKIKIYCKKHGFFYQTLNNHLCGHGCPYCNESLSEKKINNYLKEKKIKVVRQKKFDGCLDIRQLPFDFYLPDLNTCIEYDGEHHFKEVWGNNEEFLIIKKHDNIKNKYCIDNNIKLYRITKNDNLLETLNDIIRSFD
jgi:hypothetical protein